MEKKKESKEKHNKDMRKAINYKHQTVGSLIILKKIKISVASAHHLFYFIKKKKQFLLIHHMQKNSSVKHRPYKAAKLKTISGPEQHTPQLTCMHICTHWSGFTELA